MLTNGTTRRSLPIDKFVGKIVCNVLCDTVPFLHIKTRAQAQLWINSDPQINKVLMQSVDKFESNLLTFI